MTPLPCLAQELRVLFGVEGLDGQWEGACGQAQHFERHIPVVLQVAAEQRQGVCLVNFQLWPTSGHPNQAGSHQLFHFRDGQLHQRGLFHEGDVVGQGLWQHS